MNPKTVEQVIKNYYLCLPVTTKENVKLLIQEIKQQQEIIESLKHDNQFTHEANKRQIEELKKLHNQIAILSIGGTPTQ